MISKIQETIVHKLSEFILDASLNMFEAMNDSIVNDLNLQQEIKAQLKIFDVFKTSKRLEKADIQNVCLLSSFLYYLKSVNKQAIDISIFDEFNFTQEYKPIVKRNIKEIQHLNLNELNTDIFGSVYNTLFNNAEQSEKGQHFTNNDEIDIINSFCINEQTENVIDTACGAGAFLIRAYALLKDLNPKKSNEDLLKMMYGVDMAAFPSLLAKFNLSDANTKGVSYNPKIINADFRDLSMKSKHFKTPFDACIGNPPFIRQELIKDKAIWSELAKNEFGIKSLNKQSDLYVYYLMHTVSLLKERGRLGYVIASSWLDVSYGKDLQKFLLDHFKIIAIIDSQNARSFQTASVNTVILIIEKCSNQEEREKHNVKFVKIKEDYSHFIGQFNDSNRFKKLNKFIQDIEKSKNTNDYTIKSINQLVLEQESTIGNKYQNGHWGAKYLRAPDIYNKILRISKTKLIPLKEICEVKYGIKTGSNDFFYLRDETHILESKDQIGKEKALCYSKLDNKHHIIERKYLRPLLKSQREINKLRINESKLKSYVLDIKSSSNKSIIESNSELNKYIKLAESSKYKINTRATCSGRISKTGESNWYNLGKEIAIGDFIFPSKIGERFQLMDNRKANVYCDKVNYNICVKPEYKEYSDVIFAILNSTVFRFFIDLFSRQLTGSQTLSDVDVNVVQNTLIPDPKLFIKNKLVLNNLMDSMLKRNQESIFKELEFEDRKKLDSMVLSELGLNKTNINELRDKAVEFVQIRKTKSESIKTIKKSKIKT